MFCHLLFAGTLRTHRSHSTKLGVPWAFDHVFISLWKGLELTELGAELFRKLESLVYHGLVLATLCYLRSPPQGRV